jgi:hypothetical protein
VSTTLNDVFGADARIAQRRPGRLPDLVVAGGGGMLGSAILEQLIARRRHASVRLLVTQDLRSSVAGVEPWRVDAATLQDMPHDMPHDSARHVDIGLIVFDHRRHANGRELAFLHPTPADLAPLARWMTAHGARDLIVVTPHQSSTLPGALKAGLNNLDEQALASLPIERLVFVRPARGPAGVRADAWLQRVADGVLAQLRMMTPQVEQPVRARKVAQFVAALADQLPSSAGGTRVAPPELIWLAAQQADPHALVEAWLAGRELPEPTPPRRRM